MNDLRKELYAYKNETIATHSQKFFKAFKGGYGEGDKFLGIRVPVLRTLSKKYKKLDLDAVKSLLQSEFHEERLLALFIMVLKYKSEPDKVYHLYIDNLDKVNNWDLVDSSAHHIIGRYLENKNRDLLYELVQSKNMWYRRVAIISSFYFIKQNDFSDALKLSELLLKDSEDLIHKAVGWMLREIGKRDLKAEKKFLDKYYTVMPRTMLRYAIEKFNKLDREHYMKRV